jgi:hypothetical protein
MDSPAARDAQVLAPTEPYAARLSRATDAIADLPGPGWLGYVALAVVAVAAMNATAWLSGLTDLGALRVDYTYWGLSIVAIVWLIDYLGSVAGVAFDAFKPALRLPEPDLAELRYRLTVIPARPTLALTAAGIAIPPIYYALDPVASGIVGLSSAGLALRAVADCLTATLLLVITYQLIRQAWLVRSISAAATTVDPFQPGPLYALSELTSRTGIALVVLVGSTILVVPPPATGSTGFVLWLPWVVGIPVLAAAAFVLPLLGIHRRLVAEKQRLEGEVSARLASVIDEVNGAVDARDDGRADGLAKLLAAMLQQRDVVARLPTWPWSAGTLRGFLSAILLPLVIFLLQRLLTQLV